MSSRLLRAAVIGLGQAGSRFDEEPRGAVWSHAGAYLALADRYQLVAGVDPDAGNRTRFAARCPGVPCFTSVSEMAAAVDADVVSIATPIKARAEVFRPLLDAPKPPGIIICEKPLGADAATRRFLVENCRARGITLLVHYNRRYSRLYRRFAGALKEGVIGDVASITVRAPNRLWSIGSHALDLLMYLVGEQPADWQALPLPALSEAGEPAVDFIAAFPCGTAGRVLTQGLSRVLIFEVDAIGSTGRLTARGNGQVLELHSFQSSDKYLGYLVEAPRAKLVYRTRPNESTFISIAAEAQQILMNQGQPTCTGEAALASEELIDELQRRVETALT